MEKECCQLAIELGIEKRCQFLGEIPEDSEQLNHEIKLKGCICKILSVKEHRIEKIHLTIDESITGEEDDEVDETAEPEE